MLNEPARAVQQEKRLPQQQWMTPAVWRLFTFKRGATARWTAARGHTIGPMKRCCRTSKELARRQQLIAARDTLLLSRTTRQFDTLRTRTLLPAVLSASPSPSLVVSA
jgi:hypothetical protein